MSSEKLEDVTVVRNEVVFLVSRFVADLVALDFQKDVVLDAAFAIIHLLSNGRGDIDPGDDSSDFLICGSDNSGTSSAIESDQA